MAFADKIKEARKNKGMTQKQLADLAGVSYRAVQTWEAGRLPKSLDPVMKLAKALDTTSEELLDETDRYVIEAGEKGGSKAADEVEKLVSDFIGLFAGGELDEDEKDGIMAAVNEAYWIAKKNNKKYTPKKYGSTNDGN